MQQVSLSSFNKDTTINPFNHLSFTFKAGSEGDDIKSNISITESEELNNLSLGMQNRLYHLTMKCFLEESYLRYKQEGEEGADLSDYMESILSYLISLDEKRKIN